MNLRIADNGTVIKSCLPTLGKLGCTTVGVTVIKKGSQQDGLKPLFNCIRCISHLAEREKSWSVLSHSRLTFDLLSIYRVLA